MTLSAEHLAAIAADIKRARERSTASQVWIIDLLAVGLAANFAQANLRFDEDKFFAAAGVPVGKKVSNG